MEALVEISGNQFQVKQDDIVKVPLLEGNPGDKVEFGNILLTTGEGDTKVGTPFIDGSVEAEIIEHGKDEKVLVFHKKRRKGYQKLNGHRQRFTKIAIKNINI
jgi:large subunit ribosomal protein L21